MAAPAYATDLTDIIADMPNTTGWTLITDGGGGANSLTAPETDDFIQGSNSISRNPWTSANIRGMVYNSSQTITTDDAVFIWWKADVAQALRTFANGGIQCLIGSGTAALDAFYVAGSDTYALGGWRCSPIDPNATPDTTIGTAAGTSYFGVRWAVAVSGPSKGFPYKIDAIRWGRDIEVTAGDSGDPATWAKLATHADEITRRWGIVQGTNTGAIVQGRVYWGTASTAVYSRDQNRTVTLADTLGFTVADFTQLIFSNASTDLVWTNITIASLDTTNNRGLISVLNNAVVSFLGCSFADINTTTDGGTNSTWDGSAWRRCNAVTAAGGSFLGCTFSASTVAADASALVWNIATDPDGLLDGSTFTQGANAHHAIEFGTSSPTEITLRDMTFTDFDADTTNGAALYFRRTTGTVTVNLADGTTTPTYKTDGATIVIQASVSLTIGPLVAGSAITIADVTDQTVYYDNGSTGTSATFTYNAASLGGEIVNVVIIEPGYEPYEVKNYVLASGDSALNVAQITDDIYANP